MSNNKRKNILIDRDKSRNNKRPRFNVEKYSVNSIKDLIKIGNSFNFYKNIDIVMLWRILPHLEELDKMIGMNSLKETLFFQLIYYLQKMHTKNKNEEYLHTIIMGSPGHGKTEVAKILGKIYESIGILSSSKNFKIAYRDDFIAEFLGQTAIKTRKLLNSCIGGVLFIDEVYSLAPRDKDKDSFSKEALDTLTSFLSEHKNDFCCIAAGYEEDIQKCFFAMNKGLERRFTWIHKIDDYTSEQLMEILKVKIIEMKWGMSFETKDVIELINNNKDRFKNAGGDIETFLTKCKMIHSKRVFSLSKKHKFVITKEDLINTMEYINKNFKKPEVNKSFYEMYT